MRFRTWTIFCSSVSGVLSPWIAVVVAAGRVGFADLPGFFAGGSARTLPRKVSVAATLITVMAVTVVRDRTTLSESRFMSISFGRIQGEQADPGGDVVMTPGEVR